MTEVAAALAAQLGGLPGVVETLLARHVPDEAGRCCGCTTPGTGMPGGVWPCALHFYATAAAHIEADRTRAGRG